MLFGVSRRSASNHLVSASNRQRPVSVATRLSFRKPFGPGTANQRKFSGGEGEIRTHGTHKGSTVFETDSAQFSPFGKFSLSPPSLRFSSTFLSSWYFLARALSAVSSGAFARRLGCVTPVAFLNNSSAHVAASLPTKHLIRLCGLPVWSTALVGRSVLVLLRVPLIGFGVTLIALALIGARLDRAHDAEARGGRRLRGP